MSTSQKLIQTKQETSVGVQKDFIRSFPHLPEGRKKTLTEHANESELYYKACVNSQQHITPQGRDGFMCTFKLKQQTKRW